MKTRVQLTGYFAGKYAKGQADNFVVPDIGAGAVREALEPIAEIALRKHREAVGAGTVESRGGQRVRIQLTEYASKGGAYLKQDKLSGVYNLGIPGMSVIDVAMLVDHQLAVSFGVRRGDAVALVRAWGAFAEDKTGRSAESDTQDSMRPELLGKPYNRRSHLGLCAVVTGPMLKVVGLWEGESDAVLAARRIGARVVDANGFLVPEDEVSAAPEAAPDR